MIAKQKRTKPAVKRQGWWRELPKDEIARLARQVRAILASVELDAIQAELRDIESLLREAGLSSDAVDELEREGAFLKKKPRAPRRCAEHE